MTRAENAPAAARNILYISLLVILGGMYFSLSYDGVFFAPDEGASVYHFEKVAEGAIQHRDFYSVYGVGYYALGKTLFNLFGFNLIVMRKFVLLVKLVIAILIYCISIRFMRASFAFLSAMGFVIWWGDPFIYTPTLIYPAQIGQALGLLSVLFFFTSLENNRRRFVLLAGMAAGLSSLFKPNVGVFNLLALHFFVFEREMLSDLMASSRDFGSNNRPFKLPLGKIGIGMEIGGFIAAAAILLGFFAKFGFDLAIFAYALLPFYLVIAYLLLLGIRSLQTQDKGSILWENHKHALRSHFLLGAGFMVWQLAQVAYFAGNEALGDFYRMLTTATSYYSFYALPLWQGTEIIIMVGGTLLIAVALNVVMRKASGWKASSKSLLVAVVILLLSVLPLSWYLSLDNPNRLHFLVRAVLMSFSFLVCLYLSCKELPGSANENDAPNLSGLSLITIFAAVNLLDAFPKVDPGHIVMVMPPFFILFGILAQRFYDFWKGFFGMEYPRTGKRVANALTSLLMLGIFLPSFFMMISFNFLILPSREGMGRRLYNGRLTPVPRYAAGIERAEGIALRTFVFEGNYWPPLVDPEMIGFFELAERIVAITEKEDKLFSTMTSGLMLYFLADRDSVSDIANCYVWQTAMGTTTSRDIDDFSDRDLWEIMMSGEPKAIVVKKGDIETDRFIKSWPITWNFIQVNYRVSESVGAFQIYVPVK